MPEKLAYVQKRCLSLIGKAMHSTRMLHPGARVGVAASGGADSFVLLQALLLRRRKMPFHFDIMALHVNPGYDPEEHLALAGWLKDKGLAAHLEIRDFGPMAHSDRNRGKSPCFLCSWHKRKRLFELCREYGLTHLAMGHNAEDLAATFFMNLFRGGRVEGMGAKESFFKGALTLIRPNLLVEKKMIRKAASLWNLPVAANPCPAAGRSHRDETIEWLEETWAGDKRKRRNVLAALGRMELEKAGPKGENASRTGLPEAFDLHGTSRKCGPPAALP